MGVAFFLFLVPYIVTVLGFFFGFLFFIATCMITMGVSGIIMNKIYVRQMQSLNGVIKGFYNTSAIIVGIIIGLIPIGFVLYMIIGIVV